MMGEHYRVGMPPSDPSWWQWSPASPMSNFIRIHVRKHHRMRCASCKARRVCFSIQITPPQIPDAGSEYGWASPPVCGKCAGVKI